MTLLQLILNKITQLLLSYYFYTEGGSPKMFLATKHNNILLTFYFLNIDP